MENKLLEAEMDSKSFKSYLNKLNLAPPEFILGVNSVLMEEDQNGPFVLSQNSEPNLTKSSKRENDIFESEKKDNPVDSFLKKDALKPPESKKEDPPNEQGPSFMDSFLVELVNNIKNALASIYHATALTTAWSKAREKTRSSVQPSPARRSSDSRARSPGPSTASWPAPNILPDTARPMAGATTIPRGRSGASMKAIPATRVTAIFTATSASIWISITSSRICPRRKRAGSPA